MYFNRIAVMGAGSMGTLLGACLTRAGRPVDLIDIDSQHVDALNAGGATVRGTMNFNVPVHALIPEEMEGVYDLVFLLVKQTNNRSAFEQLKPHLHKKGIVCTLQNGIPEPVVAAAFGKRRTLGCAVTWAAILVGPGVVECTAERERWSSLIGSLNNRFTEKIREVQEILSLVCPTEFIDNLMGIRWSKLLINCSFSGICAALGCTFGEILENEKAFKYAQYIARECIRVSEVQGYEMVPMADGKNFKALMDFEREEDRPATARIYHELWGSVKSGKASMLQDLEKGRRSEIDAINGLLSRTGRRFGVPTPVNDRVVKIVKAIEKKRLNPCIENLEIFKEL
ncbi:MAG: 2-dehydropantoate 2-reductase [Deltaproteobacteria bacterium]|nr:2-dehydropantoate 2-reductase [Deltaproteobacteria bacterium]